MSRMQNELQKKIMNFLSLKTEHFPLLVAWLNTPHVAEWWSDGKVWDEATVAEKYSSYVDGYKVNEQGEKKPIFPFVIEYKGALIGYIQYYNVLDFERESGGVNQQHLPTLCAALDFFIGDKAFLGKGLGTAILVQFLQEHIFKNFNGCYVDPEKENSRALCTYEKAGFTVLALEDQAILKELSIVPLVIFRSHSQKT